MPVTRPPRSAALLTRMPLLLEPVAPAGVGAGQGVVQEGHVVHAACGLAADRQPVGAPAVRVLHGDAARGFPGIGLDRDAVVAVLDVGVADQHVADVLGVHPVGVARGDRGLDPHAPYRRAAAALEQDVVHRRVDQVDVVHRQVARTVADDQLRVLLSAAAALGRRGQLPPGLARSEHRLTAASIDDALMTGGVPGAHQSGAGAGQRYERLTAVVTRTDRAALGAAGDLVVGRLTGGVERHSGVDQQYLVGTDAQRTAQERGVAAARRQFDGLSATGALVQCGLDTSGVGCGRLGGAGERPRCLPTAEPATGTQVPGTLG